METERKNCVGKCLEVKKGYNGDFWRNLKVLVALLIKNSIMVATERNDFNRKADRYEHRRILPCINR